jgi:uncharacterized protein (DUF1800 family)
MTEHAFIALNRFGYGPGPSGLNVVAADPRGYLLSQLEHPRIPAALADQGGLKKSAMFIATRNSADKPQRQALIRTLIADYRDFVDALTREQVATQQPLVERLVSFWTNHFTVSSVNRATLGLYRDYQYRAIRPHVTGTFSDLLIAVCQHPAMLLYLDNVTSFGPDARFAKRKGRGLNENLAREILELHTLGVDGGYTQDDVIALAKILTGWTLDRDAGRDAGGETRFAFVGAVHQPGSKRLLGRRISEGGVDEGVAALKMLAAHPATARHIARKIATHFVSDTPPERLVARLEKAYRDSGGHLGTVIQAMIAAPESWEEPLSKIKPTPDFVISAFRATGHSPTQRDVLQAFDAQDYRAFSAPSPKGYPDRSEDWAAPGALMKRIEWAQRLAKGVGSQMNPTALGQTLFGPVMSSATAAALNNPETAVQGFVLLLMSPEFQRR